MDSQPSPPIASSSRLPHIQTQSSHAFDDQAAEAAALLLQIKRSPSTAHAPLLPQAQDMRPLSYTYYPLDHAPANPCLPSTSTDFQPQYSHAHGPATGYFALPLQQQQQQPTFHHYVHPPHSPLSPPSLQPSFPPRKRKRVSPPQQSQPHPPPPLSPEDGTNGKGKRKELRIDVEGDFDAEIEIDGIDDCRADQEGEVRCICGFDIDDGFTIQCERCHVWQHAACFTIPSVEAAPEVWLCERCDPAPKNVDHEAAKRMQKERLGVGVPEGGRGGGPGRKRGRGAPGSPRVDRRRGGGGGVRRRASSAAQHPFTDTVVGAGRRANAGAGVAVGAGRKKDSSSEPLFPAPLTRSPDPPHPPENASDEPWTEQYVPITTDIVHPTVQPKLRAFAHAWRGITAFTPDTDAELSPITSCIPMPAPPSLSRHRSPSSTLNLHPNDKPESEAECTTVLHPLPLNVSHPSRPPTYTLHALRPIARQSYVVPYTCSITPSSEYLREPTSQYAQLGLPKQGVHIVPPPLELCLDARGVGGEGRWVRSGCHPNAVLRPVVCDGKKAYGEDSEEQGTGGKGSRRSAKEGDSDTEPEVSFGVFAIRDLKADEEIVLGWEWDDRHVVHELPRLLKEGYGTGTPRLKRAMGEVLSTLFSTFTTCACGASAHDCAIAQMQRVAELTSTNTEPDTNPLQHVTSHERQHDEHEPDLGPLIGATRGMRTTERGQGGREGVEIMSGPGSSVEHVARAFRGGDPPKHVHFPAPAPQLVLSPATTTTSSPRKAWERRYSDSRAADSSDDNDMEERTTPTRSRKKARTSPHIDPSPSAEDRVHDARLQEETLPPKMRKKWIKETLRSLNAEDIGEEHMGLEHERMDVDEPGRTFEGFQPPLDASTELKSPSTALAGLSLWTSASEAQRTSPLPSPLLPDSPAPPASPTPALSSASPEHAIPSPQTPSLHLPSDGQLVKCKPPKAPSPSPTRSQTSGQPPHNPRPSSVAQSKSPNTAAPPITPLLPSFAVNANPLPLLSPPSPPVEIVPTRDSSLAHPAPVDHAPLETASSALSHTANEPPPTPLPPKKPHIKRRTLADWKSRKEKEKVAQALLLSQTPKEDTPLAQPSLTEGRTPAISPRELLFTHAGGTIVDQPNDPDQSSSVTLNNSMDTTPCLPSLPHRTFGDFESEKEFLESSVRNAGLTPEYHGKPHDRQSPTPTSLPSPALSSRSFDFTFDAPSQSPFSAHLSRRPPLHVVPPRKDSPLAVREDGEIGTSPMEVAPPQLPSSPSSRPSSQPPSRPRSPPTHPRSFRAPSPAPSLTHSSPPSRPRGEPPSRHSTDLRPNSRGRPVPSGPRALRNGFHLPSSPGSSSYANGSRGHGRSPASRGGFYSSIGPLERESDRGWAARSRGRGGSGFGGGGGRR